MWSAISHHQYPPALQMFLSFSQILQLCILLRSFLPKQSASFQAAGGAKRKQNAFLEP